MSHIPQSSASASAVGLSLHICPVNRILSTGWHHLSDVCFAIGLKKILHICVYCSTQAKLVKVLSHTTGTGNRCQFKLIQSLSLLLTVRSEFKTHW